MSTGKNRYGLPSTSSENKPATRSEQYVANHFSDHRGTNSRSHYRQRNIFLVMNNDNYLTTLPIIRLLAATTRYDSAEVDSNPLDWNNLFELFQTATFNNPRLNSGTKYT